ncbi:MAG: hypothetical protein K6T59_09605 [Bryobacteraceae bacterium]|nr:hypothetical protein [Bryobacteraceae bacterium]
MWHDTEERAASGLLSADREPRQPLDCALLVRAGSEGWLAIQAALSSGTTTIPAVAYDPQCYRQYRQFVVKTSVGLNADGRRAPAFIFVRRRSNPSTEPAVIQIP